MITKKAKKGAGGKLLRSEILQTRLSPQLRLMVEIMAREQRRTVSSCIEKAIEEAAERYLLPVLASEKAQTDNYLRERRTKKLSIKETVHRIWAPFDADRFALFALFLPDLLTSQEAWVWQLITDCPYFWEHFEINIETSQGEVVNTGTSPRVNATGLIRPHLREHWPLLQAILEDQAPIESFQALNLPIGRITAKPSSYLYPI